MPHRAVGYSLHPTYQQQRELLERYELLVKSYNLHRHAPVYLSIAPSAGMLVADNHVAYLAVHHVKDKLASILYQRKRSMKQ